MQLYKFTESFFKVVFVIQIKKGAAALRMMAHPIGGNS